MTISPISSSSGFVSLDAFTQAAAGGREVYADIAGERLQVMATGSLPNGRSVAWIAPNVDTASMFVDTLARTFGTGVGTAVARELDLVSAPGKPLSSRTVTLAVDMAREAGQALGGVDFVTQLAFSAKASGAEFERTASALGISGSLDAAQRQTIDDAMQRRFDEAATSGNSPVPPSVAQSWLSEILNSRLA
ncbi:hypothetical protein FXN63_22255 [Pigmentiphaga aceris]|uniref:Uncharacterized protein n=1 Tax=Pigmentiphaga aceris TaxID=1940612 RepID=A0A5C0B2X3_9BURK|nr:hypothetical protein [Pigmentiphaga aceris]QEI08254.1 hypothetical protein FXN63_22255 [Pigmentiphaga aceris]